MNCPGVSVIVTNCNHAGFLRRRIETILGTESQDFEQILLDDLLSCAWVDAGQRCLVHST
jgi:hypothetical protein